MGSKDQTCYACGGYSYTGLRHRACPPRYSRSRLRTCPICLKPCLGAKHRKCGAKEPTNPCGYCGDGTRGAYHKPCTPLGLGNLAVFRDLPDVVQRRCWSCGEWYPFAGINGAEVNVSDAWPNKGTPHSGRTDYYGAQCKACLSAKRAQREANYYGGRRAWHGDVATITSGGTGRSAPFATTSERAA